VSSGGAVPVNVYDATQDKRYQLTNSNAQAATTSWGQLNIDGHPKHVDYYFIGGTGNPTSKAYLFNGTHFVQTITEDGDGTVPLWSALAGKYINRYTVFGSHLDILGTPQLKQTLDEIFGLSTMTALLKGTAGVTVTVNKRTFKPDEIMHVLVIPDTPTSEIDGRLTLTLVPKAKFQAKTVASDLVPYGAGSSLTYKGPETSHLSTRLVAPRISGAYILRFEGSHASTDASSAIFFVNAASTGSIRLSKPEAAKEEPAVRKTRVSKKKRRK
jgi:nitrogen fixation protein FixH